MVTKQSSASTAEIAVATELYAAINRNDIEAACRLFAPEIERIEPESFPTAGTYRGLAAMKAHLAKGRGTWAEGSCEPEQFIVAGDKVVVYLYVRVRLKDKQDWVEGRFADGLVVRGGKVTQMHSFAERQQALDWAGILAELE